jgi:hypothetical protein
METLKLFSVLFLLAGVYMFAGNDDYHKSFDNVTVIRYNCSELLGDWHPDVPTEVIEQCRETKRESVYVKTY